LPFDLTLKDVENEEQEWRHENNLLKGRVSRHWSLHLNLLQKEVDKVKGKKGGNDTDTDTEITF
jgi:hypothetical protein